jgi:hypothetical protein
MKPCFLYYATKNSQDNSIWGNMINYYYDHVYFEHKTPLYQWLAEAFKARVEGGNIIFEDEKYYNWFMLKFQ